MATQSEFINTPVKVLNRSAFNKSHQNLLSLKVGTLVPVLVDELIPDSTIDLRSTAIAKLPPLASDTFMRLKMHLEAFFVPYRILYGGYMDAMTGQVLTAGANSRTSIPRLGITAFNDASDYKAKMGPGTLFDYLGFKTPTGSVFPNGSVSSPAFYLNIFPFLAYHRIYDDWYRNPRVQNPVFSPVASGSTPVGSYGSTGVYEIGSLPYIRINALAGSGSDSVEGPAPGSLDSSYSSFLYGNNASGTFVRPTFGSASGVNNGKGYIDTLRQRNFGHDYFTSASLTPTVGTMPSLVAPVSGGNASFTIGALRSANSLTEFAERNALCGTRYSDWLKANYGVELSEMVQGRAQYLGRMVFDVYSKGVLQTSNSSGASTRNPFDSVGAQYGDAVGVGEDTLFNNFYVREPGVLMVLASLVPKVTYSTGSARYLRHYTGAGFRGDLANQLLENVGPQPIFKSELDGNILFSSTPDSVFGYTDRFAEFKTKFDEIHGILRDGESLESFALQRSFGNTVSLNSSFIEIPTSYLDQVAAVVGDISSYGCWLDCAFDYKVVQPLSRYSTPSLVMPAAFDGHTEIVKRSGTHL